MKSSSKKAAASSRMLTLHQRLHNALKLGRSGDAKGRNWHCTDLEIQRLVIRSIDAFLDCVSSETARNPVVKDSVVDMLGALGSILQSQSESLLNMASGVAAKMVNVLPSSMLQSHVFDLVHPLSSLLCSQRSQVAISCATALNIILSNLSIKQEKEVWEILKERNAVRILLNYVNNFSIEDEPIEYFQEMAFLLSKILWRWPPSRFCVWTDSKLLDVIDNLILKPRSSLKVAILQLYSSLALCGYGAKRLLESGRNLIGMMVDCMNSSYPLSVQMEGFILAETLMASKQGCTEVMKLCCEPVVNSIIKQMNNRHLHSGKASKDQMALILVVCRLALITSWAGDHQKYFWKAGVCRALLGLLLYNFGRVGQALHHMTLQEQIEVVHKGRSANFFPSLRPYIWDILGGLAASCAEDFNPEMHGAELHLNTLILCACLALVESIRMACQVSQDSTNNTFGSESACRAVLMLAYSPSKYIASQTRSILSEVLELNRKDYTEYLLNTLNATSCNNSFGIPSNLQIVTSLVSLSCYACLPNYRKRITNLQGIRTLLTFLRWWLSSPVYVKRSTLAPHLHNSFTERTCCIPCVGDWDGEDMLLLFCLWALAELIKHSGPCANFIDGKMDSDGSQLVRELEEICMNNYSPGSRWCAACILSHFGLYGFPSKFGERIGKAFMEKELADLGLTLMNQETLHVHKVILMVRCPSLLPPEEQLPKEKLNVTLLNQEPERRSMRSIAEVRLSAHVDRQSLLKVLEYVYFGYLQADEDLLKKLKVLAKHCDMKLLLHMLHKRNPRWGSPIPTFDLTSALGQAGYYSSDILLESKTAQLHDWRCSICSASNPHFHVHKVILGSGCDYFHAVFHSGMQESISHSMKVPVSWESLVKLVTWLYSYTLPKPVFGCLWVNLDISEKINELHPYVELCWLAEFWLLEDLHDQCFKVVVSAMETDIYLSVKVIQLAANFSQWKLAEVAATYMAPLYNQLRNTGGLDQLDEGFTEMARAASVQLSQKENSQS